MRLPSFVKSAAFGLAAVLSVVPPARAQTTEYIYDTRNELVEVRRGESLLVRFQWDANGRLIRKIGQLGVRDYVYDGRRLLAEYDENGDEVAKYNWAGDRVVSVERAGEGIRYFHHDGLGSVVTLTDDSGSVVARYLWDAWGNLRNQDVLDANQNRIGYTGHRFDEETGFHHAQTRHVDPTIGRFTTQDTYPGELDDPASQNRFAYAHGNPTKYVDPTGEFVFLVPILIGVIAAELDIIHQEVTQGRDLFTLDPSRGVDVAKAAKTGAIAAAATATGQVLAGGALAATGALGVGGAAVGATGTSTGSALIAGTVGGAGAAWTGGTLAGLAQGQSLAAAGDQGSIAALPGTIGGAAGVLAAGAAQGLASSAGASPVAARLTTAFAGGFAADQAAQQTMIATGLQERTNLAQSFASGAIAYVVTEGTGSTARLEPAVRQAPSRVATKPGEAFFWSGRTKGVGGEAAAREIAASRGGTTLEALIAERGIEMPPFNPADPASVRAWADLSREYAQSASGTVRAVVGDVARPSSVWHAVELPALKANPNVTQIVVIDPLTRAEKVIFQR